MIDPAPFRKRTSSDAVSSTGFGGEGSTLLGSPLLAEVRRHRQNARCTTVGQGQFVKVLKKEWASYVVTMMTTAIVAVTYGGLLFKARALKGSEPPNGYVLWLLVTITSQVANQAFSGMNLALSTGAYEMIPIIWAIFDSIGDSFEQDEDPQVVLGTCLVTLFVANFGVGVLFIVGGKVGVSRWLRVVPAVVLRGALFGIGLFLMSSGVTTANSSGAALSFSDWPHWGSTVVLGTFVFFLDQTWNSPIAIMSTLVAIAIVPQVLVALGMTSLERLREDGWLIHAESSGSTGLWFQDLASVYANALPLVHWQTVIAQAPNIAGLWATHMLCTVTDLKTMELIMEIECDLDQELVSLGIGNLIGTFCGAAWPAYNPLSPNVTAQRMGGESRVSGWMKILTTLPMPFMLEALIPRLPCALPCTVTFWLGLSFLKETFLSVLFEHSHGFDAVIVAVMALVSLYESLLTALFIGSLLAVWQFTFLYTGLSPVVRSLDTASFVHSNVHRSVAESLMIERLGHRIAVIHLEGYIMFGSSPQLVDAVRPMFEPDGPKWIVISFSSVKGLDYSAICDISALGKRAVVEERCLVLTEFRGSLEKCVAKSGLPLRKVESAGASAIPTGLSYIKHGQPALKRCEDELLKSVPIIFSLAEDMKSSNDSPAMKMVRKSFGDFLDTEEDMVKFMSYFQVLELRPGEVAWDVGQVLNFALGVVQGELHGLQPSSSRGGKEVLMEVVCPGAFVGMFALFNGSAYTQKVVVPDSSNEPCIVVKMTNYSFSKLSQDEPRLCNALFRGALRRAGNEWRLLARLASQI